MLIASLGPLKEMGGEKHYPIEVHHESRPVGREPDGSQAYQCGLYTELRNGQYARSMVDLGPERRFAEAQNTLSLAAHGFMEVLSDSIYASYGVHSVREVFRQVYDSCRGHKWHLHCSQAELSALETGEAPVRLNVAESRTVVYRTG
jgi:hypothetical protein